MKEANHFVIGTRFGSRRNQVQNPWRHTPKYFSGCQSLQRPVMNSFTLFFNEFGNGGIGEVASSCLYFTFPISKKEVLTPSEGTIFLILYAHDQYLAK